MSTPRSFVLDALEGAVIRRKTAKYIEPLDDFLVVAFDSIRC